MCDSYNDTPVARLFYIACKVKGHACLPANVMLLVRQQIFLVINTAALVKHACISRALEDVLDMPI